MRFRKTIARSILLKKNSSGNVINLYNTHLQKDGIIL